jgi:hypothetical protein
MNRVVTILLSVLIALVAVNAVLVWHSDKRAHDDAEKQACIQKAEATGVLTLVVPSSSADAKGRLQAAQTLVKQLDAC